MKPKPTAAPIAAPEIFGDGPVEVTMRCGYRMRLDPDKQSPVCPHCGETVVARVKAPPPRFTGAVSGPYAKTAAVEPIAPNLAPSGPMPMKEPHHG